MIAFSVQPMLTPPEKNVDVNGIFEMTEENKIGYLKLKLFMYWNFQTLCNQA